MRIALYQPDIPQNTGTILRMCACLDIAADIIEPAGFPTSDRAFRRAGLDYLDSVRLTRHRSFSAFQAWRRDQGPSRLILLTSKAGEPYTEFAYTAEDILLLGRESGGVPKAVADSCDAAVRIPVAAGLRTYNVAVAAAMVAGEALRQTDGFPATPQAVL